MRELEQRRRPMYILSLRLLTIVLLLIAYGLLQGVWSMYQKERETYTGRTQAERELADIQQREATLRGDIGRLRSPEGVEASLREQFDMAKEGEKVIVIVDREESDEEAASADIRSVSTWKRLIPLAPWKLFGQ